MRDQFEWYPPEWGIAYASLVKWHNECRRQEGGVPAFGSVGAEGAVATVTLFGSSWITTIFLATVIGISIVGFTYATTVTILGLCGCKTPGPDGPVN